MVTDVDKDGTLKFTVKYGELYDEFGKQITSDVLEKRKMKNYKSADDRFSLCVSSGQMHDDGFDFYKSVNEVWLTEKVPLQYIERVTFDNTEFNGENNK